MLAPARNLMEVFAGMHKNQITTLSALAVEVAGEMTGYVDIMLACCLHCVFRRGHAIERVQTTALDQPPT
jgi:hypothetical protein